MANPSIQLGTNSNWAVKEDKLLAYKEYNDYFFNKEFDFSRGTSATYVAKDGLIASAASGLPRIDFTNDTKGHLLLEPQSTNLLQRSNEFDNSYWGKQNITATANSAISPDGTNNAFLLDVGTANDDHSIRKTALPPTATYSVSIFAKKGSTDYAWFLCGGSSRGVQAIFDLSDGSVTDTGVVGSAQTLVSAKSIDMGNGWYRLIMEAETTSSPSNNLTITPYYQSTFNGNITTSWQGNNENIYIYGAMNEESSFATSYIPTTSATSTRNADVCNNSGTAQDFNSEEGVLYAEIAALEPTSSGSKFISISDGTYNNRASILFSNGATNQIRCFLRVGGTSQTDQISNVSNVTDFNKVAFSYKENEFKVFINGSQAGSTDTSGSVWSSGTITKLSLTEINSALGALNGKVRNVQVFTEALTDSELQELTS